MEFQSTLKFVRYTALAIYGIIGVVGWHQYDELSQKINSNKLVIDNISSDMTINYVKAMVWYHSRGKLQELRSILLNDDLKQRSRIEVRIKNMLMHRTSAYIREFNTLGAPVKNLGDWYRHNFNFDDFLKDIYEIIFDEKLNVDEKIRNVTDVMEEYQNITSSKLIEVLTKTQGDNHG